MRRRSVLVALACSLATATATAAAADAPSRAVAMPGKLYAPAHLSVLVGTTVTWRNDDMSNHTVTADGDAFDSGYLSPGSSYSFAFTQPGHFTYHCTIHRFMNGVVDVYGLVLTGPERPVAAGGAVVLSGLAPPGTTGVSVARLGGGGASRTVRPRPDGSFTVRLRATSPGTYRATAGSASSQAVRVRIVPHVAVARQGRSLVVSTDPSRRGARVALQAYERDSFSWRTIGRAVLAGPSHAGFRIPAVRPLRLRVVVRGSSGWADAPSRAIVLSR